MKPLDYTPERRPLAARNWSASHGAAQWLAARGVTPNSISVGGFVASLGAGAALAFSSESKQPALWLVIGCALILVRGMCNMLDGMVAVSTGKASRGGELFNEVPDRLSDAVTLVGAGYAFGSVSELGYIAAVAAVFTAYVRVQGCALGISADFGGPMAKTHRMFVIVGAALYTAFVPAPLQPVLAGARHAGMLAIALSIVIAGCFATSLRRLIKCHKLLGNKS
uniref:CDP-alcohol phosphatidyltransferase family protein n=1 Tax=Prosthecobacter sp. TaxID=1965333 RepID=UPI0037835A6D